MIFFPATIFLVFENEALRGAEGSRQKLRPQSPILLKSYVTDMLRTVTVINFINPHIFCWNIALPFLWLISIIVYTIVHCISNLIVSLLCFDLNLFLPWPKIICRERDQSIQKLFFFFFIILVMLPLELLNIFQHLNKIIFF